MGCESAVGDSDVVGVAIAICAYTSWAIVLLVARAPFAVRLPARVSLGADADAIADFDAWASAGTDADGGADDFVAHAARVDR